MKVLDILAEWAARPRIQFARDCVNTKTELACDCSGLFKVLFEQCHVSMPFQLERPKAMHFFSVLQEIGSTSVTSLKPGHLLAWRKEQPPRSGDTGHVLITADVPIKLENNRYSVVVYDSTKRAGGLSRREVELFTNDQGGLIGCRLHRDDSKIKRTQIYHAALSGSRYCWGCALPLKVCQCGDVVPKLDVPNIIILRHPEERGRTLSTVSLIKQRYPSVLVKEGEVFSAPRNKNMALLFPDEAGNACAIAKPEAPQQLILLDATWRKAKRILHLNPWLAALPRVSLDANRVSNYLLRKVANEGALASVEAFALAMGDDALNVSFLRFMEAQIALIGEEVYQRNYANHLNYRG